MSNDKDRIIENYRSLYLQHGEGPAVGQWSAEGQRFRFARLAEIGDLSGKSILEIGCGIGDFYPFLTGRYGKLSYTGVDIVPELVAHAAAKYPEATFYCQDLLEEDIPGRYDFVLMSGIFNNDMSGATGFLLDMVAKAFAKCRVGTGFNFTSDRVNRYDAEMAYHDPVRVLDFCLNQITRKVVMAHHYERCDVSAFLYH